MSKQYFEYNPDLQENTRWINYEVNQHHLELKTDAGVFSKGQVDYGSKVLIQALLDDLGNRIPSKFLELGSGYGPIVLMLAKHFPQSKIEGIEINERAHALSIENAEQNQIKNVKLILGDVSQGQFDLADVVVTNPPIRAGKQLVHTFVDQAYQHLRSDGLLYVVIQKKQGAGSMEKKMKQVFSNVEKIRQDKGYWILKSKKC